MATLSRNAGEGFSKNCALPLSRTAGEGASRHGREAGEGIAARMAWVDDVL
jgi:hypothetical protein